MKISELVKEFEIYTSNEEKQMLEQLHTLDLYTALAKEINSQLKA